nr:MAG TPA: hypothetical protein [Caudoviricetes sp.]
MFIYICFLSSLGAVQTNLLIINVFCFSLFIHTFVQN